MIQGNDRAAVKDDESDPAVRLAAAIFDVSRELRRSVPCPRGAPYFLLDCDSVYDLRVLDAFPARGIFRKYAFALDLGSGLGGRARWLAARTGCQVLGIDPDASTVTAAHRLNTRAHAHGQVMFTAAKPNQLPLREHVFTHVWMLDTCDDVSPGTFAEAFRVLRPGAHFGLQAIGVSPAQGTVLLEQLHDVGFVELETRAVALGPVPDVCRLARDRLRAKVGRVVAPVQDQDVGLTCLQVFARRMA